MLNSVRSIFQATRRKASGSAATAALLANVLCRRLGPLVVGIAAQRNRNQPTERRADLTTQSFVTACNVWIRNCQPQPLPKCVVFTSALQNSVTTSAARFRSPLQPPDVGHHFSRQSGNHFQTQWQNEQSQHPQWQNEQSHKKPHKGQMNNHTKTPQWQN